MLAKWCGKKREIRVSETNTHDWLHMTYTIISIFCSIPIAIKSWKSLIRIRRRKDAVDNDIKTSEDNQDETNVQDVGDLDRTKYSLGNQSEELGKGRLVLAVIQEYVRKNPNVTYEELLKVFPASLRGVKRSSSYWGCLNLLKDARELYEDTGYKRHFMKESDIIRLSDGNEVVVSSQWGIGNINEFIKAANMLGFKIKTR